MPTKNELRIMALALGHKGEWSAYSPEVRTRIMTLAIAAKQNNTLALIRNELSQLGSSKRES